MVPTKTDEKRYYSISEVGRMTGLEPYVLRYWEKEFPSLKPRKNRGGNRMYTTNDIDLVNRINHLRKSEKLTIMRTIVRIRLFCCSAFLRASSRCALTISFAVPPGTTRMCGVLVSS